MGNAKERKHLEDLGVDGRIVLKLNFKKEDEGSGSGQGQTTDS